MAAAYYPIVFSDESVPIAAVVGLRNDSNLFVDSQGQWLADESLPAYVRRYPFILMAILSIINSFSASTRLAKCSDGGRIPPLPKRRAK